MSGSQDEELFAVVDGDGEPMWQFVAGMREAKNVLRMMQTMYPNNGPWSIVPATDVRDIIGVDGNPMLIVPQKFWN